MGKVVTIFYAIIGIPLMLLMLSHVGTFMAKTFRLIYWKVCCYVCTRRPSRVRRRYNNGFNRGRSLRSSSKHLAGNSRAIKQRSLRRSARASQRSEDSAYSDSAIFSVDSVFRRVHSDEDVRNMPQSSIGRRRLSPPVYLRPHSYPHTKFTQRSSRSAEPAVTSHPRTLQVVCNKYAEDDIDADEEPRRAGNIRPHSEIVFPGDYWEEDDEFIYDDEKGRPVPIWLCVLLVLGYILFGAFLFSGWESWSFLDSAYFSFVTLTTIGFGDFVPAQRVTHDSAEVSIALCSLYLLFGISLLAMSFNLVQEEVINSVKQVAARLGIIKEEDV